MQSQEVQKGGEVLLRKASDINDTLYFIADLFGVMHESGLRTLADMLTNALLNYAYLPIVLQSLCVLQLKPTLQLSSCIYILTQTFTLLNAKPENAA